MQFVELELKCTVMLTFVPHVAFSLHAHEFIGRREIKRENRFEINTTHRCRDWLQWLKEKANKKTHVEWLANPLTADVSLNHNFFSLFFPFSRTIFLHFYTRRLHSGPTVTNVATNELRVVNKYACRKLEKRLLHFTASHVRLSSKTFFSSTIFVVVSLCSSTRLARVFLFLIPILLSTKAPEVLAASMCVLDRINLRVMCSELEINSNQLHCDC